MAGAGFGVVIAMPNGVVGANDHSTFGYFLRLTMLGMMAPVAFGGDAVYALVDVDALAEGLCLAIERAQVGEDYVFSSEPMPLHRVFEILGRETAKMTPRLYLPRAVMRPQMALLESAQRRLGLPAFFLGMLSMPPAPISTIPPPRRNGT